METTHERCEICEEKFRPNDERAEMYDPSEDSSPSVICHADCGLWKNYEVA